MTKVTPTFQIIRGLPTTPREEWEVWERDIKRDPVMVREEVRRMNFDLNYYADKPGMWQHDPSPLRFHMRSTPASEDYHLRMSLRTDYVRFPYEPHGRTWYYPEVVDGMIAYYRTTRDAAADKRTIQKFGRYMRENAPLMTDEELSIEAAKFSIEYNDHYELKYARTREEIKHVYLNGPDSCMAGGSADAVHPTECYAVDPIAVIYVEQAGDIIARTVANTKTKKYVRIYGLHHLLGELLRKEGYEEDVNALNDTKILILKNSRGYPIAPYLDGSHRDKESECGNYRELSQYIITDW